LDYEQFYNQLRTKEAVIEVITAVVVSLTDAHVNDFTADFAEARHT
jgi:hypothetical protein